MEERVAKVKKEALLLEDELFALACEIFDHPEIGLEEVFASSLLTDYLEKTDFVVEKGIAGLPTAFRAHWEKGEGGPTIGFCMEYDALKDLGHGCGHHLQGPACIGAALILRKLCPLPFRIVLYGTPAEETVGGKAIMVDQGCFTDVDVMLSYHTGKNTFVSCFNRAAGSSEVTFTGVSAHACAAPHLGRSALDAMLLAFHGLELMREHVKDGCRIHYSVAEGTGPANVVPEKARAYVSLRSYERQYLGEMKKRMEKIVEGAAMMTQTEGKIDFHPEYWNIVSVPTLREELLRAAEIAGAKKITREWRGGGGSSDVGNVSWVVPTALLYTFYTEGKGHSEEYMTEGKDVAARESMRSAMEIFALAAEEWIRHPEKIKEAKIAHQKAICGE